MGTRGRERTVNCDSCGRQVRRDKAVFFEKVIFSNPLQREQVYAETYAPRLTREVAYCPSCGKHLRVYEKKKRLQERQRERRSFDRRPAYGHPPRRPPGTAPAPASSQPAKPAEQTPAEQKPAPAEQTPADEEPGQEPQARS
jgi:ribosomal protein S26